MDCTKLEMSNVQPRNFVARVIKSRSVRDSTHPDFLNIGQSNTSEQGPAQHHHTVGEESTILLHCMRCFLTYAELTLVNLDILLSNRPSLQIAMKFQSVNVTRSTYRALHAPILHSTFFHELDMKSASCLMNSSQLEPSSKLNNGANVLNITSTVK
jgi:hypothetical protein